jgi:hypothetical protein
MTGVEKLRRLDELANRDAAKDLATQHIAKSLKAVASWSARPRPTFWALAAALCRDTMRYQADSDRVGHEDIAGLTRAYEPATKALARGVDDCDTRARLFVAIVRAADEQAELAPKFDAEGRLEHTYARVWTGAGWLPVEFTLARARLGDEPALNPDDVPKETTGQWLNP